LTQLFADDSLTKCKLFFGFFEMDKNVGAPEAKPVSLEEIQNALSLLELSVKRMKEVVEFMVNSVPPKEHVTIRSHNVLNNGSKAVAVMAGELRTRAEDEAYSKLTKTKTKLEQSRAHRDKYAQQPAKKPPKTT